MSDQGTVNGQILDCVADTVTIGTGMAASQAFSMLDTVMVETLGMAMYNAVSRQQSSSMVGSAAVTAACARMLGAQVIAAPKPPVPPVIIPPPAPPYTPPPWYPPIPPTPPPVDPALIIDDATAQAMDAIGKIEGAMGTVQAESKEAARDANLANKRLQQIAMKAAGTENPPVIIPPKSPPPPGAATRRKRG